MLPATFIIKRKPRHEEVKVIWPKAHGKEVARTEIPNPIILLVSGTGVNHSSPILPSWPQDADKPSVIWPLPTCLSHLPPTGPSSRTELLFVLLIGPDFSHPHAPADAASPASSTCPACHPPDSYSPINEWPWVYSRPPQNTSLSAGFLICKTNYNDDCPAMFQGWFKAYIILLVPILWEL